MASITIQCREGRVSGSGYAPLRLRISHQGTRRFVSIALEVLASKWNEDRQRVTRSHPDAPEVNRRLSEVETEAQAALSRLQSKGAVLTAGRIQRRIQDRLYGSEDTEVSDFLAFAREEVESYRRRGQHSTFRAYRTGVNKLASFIEEEAGMQRLPFDEVTVGLIRDWRDWMYETKGNAANTVGKNLSQIKTLWRAAIKEGHANRDIWTNITLDSEPSQKEKLTFEEIESLEELQGSLSIPSDSKALDYFLFALYAGGMRFSDVATLKCKHIRDGRIQYKMKKTAEGAGVPIVEQAQAILDKYNHRSDDPEARVFPILDSYDTESEMDLQRAIESRNAYFNKRLKKVQEKAGIETSLSFHLARHSAAWILYRELGDIYQVKRILGHSSVEVTEEYLRGFPDESLDEDFRDVF